VRSQQDSNEIIATITVYFFVFVLIVTSTV